MRRSRFISPTAAALCVFLCTAHAHGQALARRPVHVGITAGITLPDQDLNTVGHLGWNLGVLVAIPSNVDRLSFRIDGQWLHMTGIAARSPDGPKDNETRYRIIDGTANARYTIGTIIPPGKVYAIGGAGVYFGHAQGLNFPYASSITKLGFNGGAGVQIDDGRPTTFLELRYHYILHGATLLHDASVSGTKPLNILLLTAGVVF